MNSADIRSVHAMTFLSTHRIFPSSNFAITYVFSCVGAWNISICDDGEQLEACLDRFSSAILPVASRMCVGVCMCVRVVLCSNDASSPLNPFLPQETQAVLASFGYAAVNRALFYYPLHSVEHQLAIQCLEPAAYCTRHWDQDNKL